MNVQEAFEQYSFEAVFLLRRAHWDLPVCYPNEAYGFDPEGEVWNERLAERRQLHVTDLLAAAVAYRAARAPGEALEIDQDKPLESLLRQVRAEHVLKGVRIMEERPVYHIPAVIRVCLLGPDGTKQHLELRTDDQGNLDLAPLLAAL